MIEEHCLLSLLNLLFKLTEFLILRLRYFFIFVDFGQPTIILKLMRNSKAFKSLLIIKSCITH
jgi:hypothetical protein